MYAEGPSDKAITAQLARDGIPCPSAHDAARNPHRKKTAWQAGAVRAILINPRYTGYEVWNKQHKEERLLDVDDVALCHRTHMTHNPSDQWIRSNEPAHDTIVTTNLFEARPDNPQTARPCAPAARTPRPAMRAAGTRPAGARAVRAVRTKDVAGRHPRPRLPPMRIQGTRSRTPPRARPPADHQPPRRHRVPSAGFLDRPSLRTGPTHRHPHGTQPREHRGEHRTDPEPRAGPSTPGDQGL
ncbi:recombinase family protein [Streptomyces sp. NPDC057611]|uniref:recombinase family protein n=1 Tax=Streptomyces sp. NPDC057611 TaxID=3346182 RepID=UPI0036C475C2